ncbi:MAG: phosphoribosyl-AMP cyclohydrolase [Gammaproteobacteria bacterium]|jgi:phosphoribosyl-AMP cyclohydrolase
MTTDLNSWLDEINWNENGLIPAIAQEFKTGKVLTLAWMNRESLLMTTEQGKAVYWSRKRKKLWTKGESSGHIQKVKQLRIDCDKDTILLSVEQSGGIACHTGRHSCFYYQLDKNQWKITESIIKDPKLIYKSNS